MKKLQNIRIVSIVMFGALFFGLIALFYADQIRPLYAASLSERVKGKILIRVEGKGEAWYVNPTDGKRYSLGRPKDAFELMRKSGIGITTANLNKIPVAEANFSGTDSDGDGLSDVIEDAFGTNSKSSDSDSDGYLDKYEVLNGFDPLIKAKRLSIDTNFSKKHAGKIFLQVDRHGEAWYISPSDYKRYFLAKPSDAFALMKKLGLGIKDSDLNKISQEEEKSTEGGDGGGGGSSASAYCSMFRCDTKLTGRSNFQGPSSSVSLKWKYPIPKERVINLQPSIDKDGNIYIGTWGNVDPAVLEEWKKGVACNKEEQTVSSRAHGKFYSFDKNGNLRWISDPGQLAGCYVGTVETTPAIGSNGIVYYGRGDGILYSVSSETGDIQSRFETPDDIGGERAQIIASPMIDSSNTVYFGTQSYDTLGTPTYGGANRVYAVSSGEEKWRYPKDDSLPSWVWSMVSLADDGSFYFSSVYKQSIFKFNSLYAITPSGTEGTKKWVFSQDGGIIKGHAAIGKDGTLYVSSVNSLGEESYLYALDSNGSQKWKFQTPFQNTSIPAIGSDGTLYVAAGNTRYQQGGISLEASLKEGILYALVDEGGSYREKWSTPFTLSGSAGARPPFLGSDGIIYVSSRGSDEVEPRIKAKIWAIKDAGTSAEKIWEYAVPEGEIWAGYPIVGADKTLVFATAVCTDYKVCNEDTDIPAVYVLGEE